MSFYTSEEEKQREDYVPILRSRLLKKLDDLKNKIETNEDFPHGKQDIDSLSNIDDKIEDCLNNWYY